MLASAIVVLAAMPDLLTRLTSPHGDMPMRVSARNSTTCIQSPFSGENLERLGGMDLSALNTSECSDIWGFTSPEGRRFAIIACRPGARRGVSHCKRHGPDESVSRLLARGEVVRLVRRENLLSRRVAPLRLRRHRGVPVAQQVLLRWRGLPGRHGADHRRPRGGGLGLLSVRPGDRADRVQRVPGPVPVRDRLRLVPSRVQRRLLRDVEHDRRVRSGRDRLRRRDPGRTAELHLCGGGASEHPQRRRRRGQGDADTPRRGWRAASFYDLGGRPGPSDADRLVRRHRGARRAVRDLHERAVRGSDDRVSLRAVHELSRHRRRE